MLVLPACKRWPEHQEFYLGQDCKFSVRVLGVDLDSLAYQVRGHLGLQSAVPIRLCDSKWHNEGTAAVIVQLLGGQARVREGECWDFAGN